MLLAPIWYIGFPVTIPLSTLALGLVAFVPHPSLPKLPSPLGEIAVVAIGALVYAVVPPALVALGLSIVVSALAPAAATQQPAAGTKAATDAEHTGETPVATGHSGRNVAGPGHQSSTSARSRIQPAAAVPAKRTDSGTADPSSKKSTADSSSKKSTNGGHAKRAVGSSGRNR
ncbi:hypothetical protein ORI20_27360 [Mycobacterium sp. CVI_P3]|uniref:Uncharacterized protein n=1 Tax=Mycobacterium pinniadriaticum TaxID=2994102 RepID=A0ABT3SLL8_9MYCO|nr:hypothetical protein [Mycobacterium pinniadriaticum]MCX2933992.1 hypothetical protein [Mycobacterium pinniadriaticum]MCX2940412.1 hypothetical protein [Mycobacterium pinniadriaticum]